MMMPSKQTEPGKGMRVDIPSIDRRRFHVNDRSIPGLGDFILIVPDKANWQWSPDEYHLRSLMCRPDGTVVSAGFPKFFNHGEKPDLDQLVVQGLAAGESSFLEKVDGSLIIRSVIDSQVHFRTRGCEHIADDMREDVERLIHDSYPQLLDPSLGGRCKSLLMEYVSPDNQVVIRYDQPRLVALGWADWFFGSLRVRNIPHSAGSFFGLHQSRRVKLSHDIRELAEQVSRLRDDEGVVVWTHTGQGNYHLTKFKSAWYLRLHALRSQVSLRYLREFCFCEGITTLDQLKHKLMQEGFDWEVCSYIGPLFNELRAHVDALEAVRTEVDLLLSQERVLELPSKKEIALRAKDLFQQPWFGYVMKLADGKPDEAQDIFDALCLDMNVSMFKRLKKTGPERLGARRPMEVDDG